MDKVDKFDKWRLQPDVLNEARRSSGTVVSKPKSGLVFLEQSLADLRDVATSLA